MSYEARDWALTQKNLRPSARIVLVQLASFHTDKLGCFPSQNRLVAECGVSLRSLNRQMAYLEEKGLIRRLRRIDPHNGKYESTRYTFALEESFVPKPSATLSARHVPERQTKGLKEINRLADADANAHGVRNPDTVNPDTERSREGTIDHAFRRMLRRIVDADPETGFAEGTGHLFGDVEDMLIAERWRSDLGLSDEAIISTIQKFMRRRSWQHRRRVKPVNTLNYFTHEMQKTAGVFKALRNHRLKPLDVMVGNFTFVQPLRADHEPSRPPVATHHPKNLLENDEDA